jgi:DNA-binding transcriptional ArsR family regulator
MLIWVYTMSSAKLETGLTERLERLTGEGADCCVPEYVGAASALLDTPKFASVLSRVKALADEKRLLALSYLKRHREVCACEIQAVTGLTHATVSHHMAVLEEAGWVSARRQGKWMYYRLNSKVGVEIP